MSQTLVDTMPLHYQAWVAAMREHEADLPEAMFYELAGVPTTGVIEILNERHGYNIPVQEAADRKESLYMELLPQVGPIVPVVDIIEKYSGQLPMAVATGATPADVPGHPDRTRALIDGLRAQGIDALVAELPEHGLEVGRIFWLGETVGVWDAQGNTISRITPDTAEKVLATVTGAAGTDVTGGMAHRLETALRLARRGITSWIGDGREPGRPRRALAGEAVPGTWVVPDA